MSKTAKKKRAKGTSVEFKIPTGTRSIVVKRFREVRGKGQLRVNLSNQAGIETTCYTPILKKIRLRDAIFDGSVEFSPGKVSVKKRR